MSSSAKWFFTVRRFLSGAILVSSVASIPALQVRAVHTEESSSRAPTAFQSHSAPGSPIYFESHADPANVGSSRFIARGRDCTVIVEPTEAALVLVRRQVDAGTGLRSLDLDRAISTRTVRMILEGANRSGTLHGLDPLAATANYLIGNDPAEWRTGVPLFTRVRVNEVYPDIDAIYYAHESGHLEYDFVLQPGAQPERIAFRVEGVDTLHLDHNGDLVMRVGSHEVRQHRPIVYQELDGERKSVAGGYRLNGKAVGFEIGTYNKNLPLVIDPVLSFSTYVGGSKSDVAWGVATDPAGNIYVAGETVSKKDLPVTPNALQPAFGGGIGQFGDGFVAKYDAVSHALVYLTYFGGRTTDGAFAVAADAQGNAYVTGFTDSRNFPIVPTNGALRSALTGRNNNAHRIQPVDAFVTKFSPDGTQILFSTLLGGGGRDGGNGIVLDDAGAIYVTGLTESTNFFPAPNGYQTAFGGASDAFVVKLVDATTYTYCTFLGGTNRDHAEAIAVEPVSGNVFITGITTSTNFPSINPLVVGTNAASTNLNRRTRFTTRRDAFVAQFTADGTGLVYSSYLGGEGDDVGSGIAVDANRNAFVTGHTQSRDFPVNVNPRTNQFGFAQRAFAARIGPAGGSDVIYSAVFGGSRIDQGIAIDVDDGGRAYVAGLTSSRDFFATNTFTDFRTAGTKRRSLNDGFVAVLSPDGTSFVGTNSVLLGGSGHDQVNSIVVSPSGATLYLAGQTASQDFTVTNAPQTTLGNVRKGKQGDGFVQVLQFP